MKQGDLISFVVHIERGGDPDEVTNILVECMEDTNFCPYAGWWKITFEPWGSVAPPEDSISLN